MAAAAGYRERPSRVPGGFVWCARPTGGERRVLPDGCMDLLWDGCRVEIAGADTRAQVLDPTDVPSWRVGLRFAPGFAPRVLGIPADELTDQRVPLDAVWTPDRVREVTDLVAASADPGAALESVALRNCAPSDEDTELIERVVAMARSGSNSTTIASHVGLSTRQLQRRSRVAFGYGAKTLHRVLRLQQALAFIRRGDRAVDSAMRVGYADQAHLSREVRDMAGVSVTQLLH